jgi:exodeoxyribonuclease III
MNLRISTWNINSVRLRIDQVARFVEETQPDVLCLQEIKVDDPLFPAEAFHDMGYEHHAVAGQKGYHGVATLSRIPMESWTRHHWADKEEARHVVATLQGGIDVHNFYIPAGGDIPDPEKNEKFAHKMQFLDEISAWFRDEQDATRPAILVGDLNIAPSEHDVWSHKKLLKVVSHTPIEVEKLAILQESLNWVDAVRHLVPEPEKLFSWWSYRSKDWRVNNRGRRLDHVWVTPPLQNHLQSMKISDNTRDWERPSDHAPITVDIALPG